MAMTPEMAAQGEQDAHRLTKVVSPWANGRNYLNFAESAVDPRTGYTERAWLQLKGIRSAVDPNGLFVGNHRIPRLVENGRVTD
jgi:FAD/FMN-containing dehydrogenase